MPMKQADIKKKTDKELVELVIDTRKDIQEERFKDAQSRKGTVISGGRKTVARALTELNEREQSQDKEVTN